MAVWMIATANIVLISLLVLYVAAAYMSILTRQWEAGFVCFMGICRYLFHGYGFFILYLVTKNFYVLLFYILQIAFFLLAGFLQRRIFQNSIRTLYQNMMLLLSVGFLILTRLSFSHGIKQFIIAAIANLISLLIPLVLRYLPELSKLRWLYTTLGIFLLFCALVTGSTIFGARNWLTIKNITFQPSEFVKLIFIFSMASLLVRETKKKYQNLFFVSFIAALHVGILVLSNDFGGALIFFIMYLFMLFVVSADWIVPSLAVVAGIVASLVAYFSSGHIRERVIAWQDPFSCIEKEGYQMAQSLFAIGSGGWFGTGLGRGMPTTIPVVTSDFIFAAIVEELGAIIAALILFIYINCMILMLTLALERKQPFFFAVTTGVIVLFGIQLFLNVGGVIQLIPSTGVTLAFISYGGSSLSSTIVLFQGIQGMRSVEVHKKQKEAKEIREKKTGQQLRMVGVCGGLLVLLTITTVYFTGITVSKAAQVCNNPYNRRIKQLEATKLKGKIVAADNTILAQSILGEDGMVYRLYPHGMMTAYITGQMSIGRTGLEDAYFLDLYSVGLNVFEKIKREAKGELLEGNRIVTTIDMKLQKTAYEALEGYRGVVGVVEVKTGKILTLVSTPSYDANEISVQWEQLNQRKDAPLLNRFTQGLYPPGSTFKLVTTLAYLRQHKENEFFYECLGTAQVRNTTVHCYQQEAHGKQTLEEAFANSCNTAYASLGERISVEGFQKLAKELGFGIVWEETIPYKADSFALTKETENVSFVQTMFGQGETLITPFHNLMIIAAIANKGTLQMPYLVERMENCDGILLEEYQSEGTKRLISEEEAKVLTRYMIEASKEFMQEWEERGITVAGKTGSAEYAQGKPAHAWYVCFAPAKEPEIAICVLVESVGTGREYAVPVAKKLLEVYWKDIFIQ